MVYKHKHISFNKLVVVFIGLLILSLYFYHQFQTSIIIAEKDRINIAVFSEMPFVYSINRQQNFAVVTYFHPDYLVKVPGGYDWYRVGSLNLLAKIEKQRVKILKTAFSELLGAPIDFVYYPKKAQVVDQPAISFNQFYDKFLKEKLFSNSYQSSIDNIFDRIMIKNLFQVRADHLLFLDSTDLTVQERNRHYYYSDKLDTRLKGLFYHESLISQAYKAVIITDKDKYPQAQLVLRQLEGIGIKVIEIEVVPKYKAKKCEIQTSGNQKALANKLTRLFDCTKSVHDSEIISYNL